MIRVVSVFRGLVLIAATEEITTKHTNHTKHHEARIRTTPRRICHTSIHSVAARSLLFTNAEGGVRNYAKTEFQ